MSKGLEDVVAGTSSITFIDGAKGRLLYRGYDIKDLAERSNYEEVVYLLWNGRLPDTDELVAFSRDLASKRALPDAVGRMIDALARDCDTMDALEMAIAALGIYDDHAFSLHEEAASIASKIGTIVARIHRHKYGLPVLEPIPTRASPLAFCVWSRVRNQTLPRSGVMNALLVLHADHELNASTFTARVVASTLSRRLLEHHGGGRRAEGTAPRWGEREGGGDGAGDWLARRGRGVRPREALEEGQDNGVSYIVLDKATDPRCSYSGITSSASRTTEDERRDFAILERLREVMLKEKNLYPNVDFYSGFVLHHLGIPTYLFTPVFAVGRTPGWLAACDGSNTNNRIIRPVAEYMGPTDRADAP